MINSRQLDELVGHIREVGASKYLKRAIALQASILRQLAVEGVNVFLLSDSNKKSCCTDIIGAKHVNYDLLVHFGEACFSEQTCPKHYYVLPEAPDAQDRILQAAIRAEEYACDAVLLGQGYYDFGKTHLRVTAPLLLLAPDASGREQLEHFAFGYYRPKGLKIRRLLLVGCSSQFEERLYLIKGALGLERVFNLGGELTVASTKSLVKRLSLIEKIKPLQRFGVLVSNASTDFCLSSIKACKDILKASGKNTYVFMMNNLNEAKLANFPEIEAYVIISCHNFSLYQLCDFFTPVVTPFDLLYAFGPEAPIDLYDFDCRRVPDTLSREQVEPIKGQDAGESTQVARSGSQEVELAGIFQSLSYQKTRSYQGIECSQPKAPSVLKKGKVGLAQSYRPIE